MKEKMRQATYTLDHFVEKEVERVEANTINGLIVSLTICFQDCSSLTVLPGFFNNSAVLQMNEIRAHKDEKKQETPPIPAAPPESDQSKHVGTWVVAVAKGVSGSYVGMWGSDGNRRPFPPDGKEAGDILKFVKNCHFEDPHFLHVFSDGNVVHVH